MDPRFLRYYERELKNVRELGGEFAREYPKIAGRLSLDAFECADPYVERLLEGFAFLAARVQLKIDAEFPAFTQHLLELLYPGYLAPTPSMAVVQLRPSRREGNLASGIRVPRGTSLHSRLGAGSTACEYRTGHEVTLLPLEIVSADYTAVLGTFYDVEKAQVPGAKAALRVVLRTTASAPFNKLNLDDLTFFVNGGNDVAARLHENVLSHNMGMLLQSTQRPVAFRHVHRGPSVAAVGYHEDEALLPCGQRAFQGHRLLHEYFAFPTRYMFFQVRGLAKHVRQISATELELILLFSRSDPRLEGAVRAANLALFCTPVVNLFPRVADRILLSHRDHEYHVIPDRTRPLDLEVYGISQVIGYGSRNSEQKEFSPMYALQGGASDRRAYYAVRREPRAASARERARGPRSAYAGSETFVSLVDGNFGPFDPELKQLGITTLCTNRDLPLHLVFGQSDTDFTTDSGAPVESIRCLSGPSAPKNSPVYGPTAWRLLSHLNVDYLALMRENDQASANALRSLLTLYADFSDAAHTKQVEGLNRVRSQTVVRPLPFPGPLTLGRGLEITLECDESAFEGSSAFLLGAVLERFFARYASINGFCETVLRTVQRGEIVRWPTTAGQRRMV
ncbi:MAG: type VI secretion system baseplate subunit TssF [Myxococcales bacterium]